MRGVQSEHILIPASDGNGDVPGFLVVPAGAGPWPGVVMVHEAFGIEENMIHQAEHLASRGYLVLMPDLYSRGGMRKCLGATFRALSSGEGQAFRDVEAAQKLLSGRKDCTGKMGGGFALQLAQRGYDAAAVNYGMMPKDLDAVLEGACPIVGSYGAKDKTLKRAAARMELALTQRGIAHDIKEYPAANHAFMNPGPAGPKIMRPLMQKVAGFRPRPDDAADAWSRIDAFFTEHLR
jgi:carboxymethylenebutenolidase